MNLIRNLSLGLAITACMLGQARADNVPGQGAGYYGQAEYESGNGSIVGPYPTWIQCSDALTDAIDNAVYNHGETVVSVDGCSYNSGYAHVLNYDIHMLVSEPSPVESGHTATALLEELRRVRTAYRIDDYEARLRMLEKVSGGK